MDGLNLLKSIMLAYLIWMNTITVWDAWEVITGCTQNMHIMTEIMLS